MRICTIILLAILVGCKEAPEEKATLNETIDSLFAEYNEGPGASIGVIKDGEFIFSKGYGFANLDYSIPNSPDSKFYIASMAKQFCGAALLKLESEGKLDFQKPITHYLPDFPSYNQVITVDHIIHHTSGIRGTSSMQLIAGIKSDFEDYFSADQQYEMIKTQTKLNFEPGSEFRYSSGGYIVLAKLIEAITGQSFRSYLDDVLFKPLRMSNTFVIDNHREVVKDRVISYYPTSRGFERRSMIFDGMGDGSIVTTVNDLLKWDQAFYDEKLLQIPDFAERMYETGKVRRGNDFYYGMALETSTFKGHRQIGHNGGMLAFRADLIRFPEEKLSVIVLANHGYLHSSFMAQQVAGFYLEDKTLKKEKNEMKTSPSVPKDEAEKYVGKYFSHDINQWRRISYSNDTLYYDNGNINNRISLRKTESHNFVIDQFNPPIPIGFEENTMTIDYGWMKKRFELFDDSQPKREDLKAFLGKYFSSELNTYYTLYELDGRIWVRVNSNIPFVIFPDPTDTKINWNSKSMVWLGYAMMKFQFDEYQKVTGFLIGDNRVSGIFFEKLN